MNASTGPGRVTSSVGDVDSNGDIVGELARVAADTCGPLEARYCERPGPDARLTEAGADAAAVRRMLRVAA